MKGGGVGGGRCSDEEASIHRPTAAERLAHPERGPRRARRGRWLPQEDRKCPSPERRHLHHCWSECQSSAIWTNQKAISDARTALHSPPHSSAWIGGGDGTRCHPIAGRSHDAPGAPSHSDLELHQHSRLDLSHRRGDLAARGTLIGHVCFCQDLELSWKSTSSRAGCVYPSHRGLDKHFSDRSLWADCHSVK